MSSDEFMEVLRNKFPNGDPLLYEKVREILYMYDQKCTHYGNVNDPPETFNDRHQNFYKALPVQYGILTPLQYALTLAAKHDQAIWNNPTPERMKEYLTDGIVYRLIALCLLDDVMNPWQPPLEGKK